MSLSKAVKEGTGGGRGRGHQHPPAPPVEQRLQEFVGFESDKKAQRSARITNKTTDGFVYTRNQPEETKKQEYSAGEKASLAKRSLKALHEDPFAEGEYRAIPYTDEEIRDFQRFTSNLVHRETLAKLDAYVAKKTPVHNPKEDYVVADGQRMVEDASYISQVKSLAELPPGIWDDPFCFMRGPFAIMLKQHYYVHEALMYTLPMKVRRLEERKSYPLNDILSRCHQGGLHNVKQHHVKNGNKYEFTQLEFRFMEVEPEQDEKEKKLNSKNLEDFTAVSWATLTPLIEDRLRFNMILIPWENLHTNKVYRAGDPPPTLFVVGTVFMSV